MNIIKEIARQWLTPGMLLIFLLGMNSLLNSPTTFSFNVGEKVTHIPIPALSATVGWVLLLFPVIVLILPLLGKLRKIGETKLPTEEQASAPAIDKPKRGKLSWLLDLLLYLPFPHK